MPKVLVAMSGGVDSSAAALLLQEQHYEVIGATGRMFANEDVGMSVKPLLQSGRCGRRAPGGS